MEAGGDFVFDIEADGLLVECTKMHILYVYNLSTHEEQYWLEGDLGWMEVFNQANSVRGHYIMGYDLQVLRKLFGYTLPKSVKRLDTLILSQVLNWRRFGDRGHSLEVWGEYLGHPKVEHEDWSVYSQEMFIRCREDVRLNVKVHNQVLGEYQVALGRNPTIKHYLAAEHAAMNWNGMAELAGWPQDTDAQKELFHKLEVKMNEAHVALSERLGIKTVAVDKVKGEVAIKTPKWVKSGAYDAHTANWFNIDPWSGFEGEERMVDGPYCRVEFVPLSLDSVADVKTFLYRNNWVPTEWNIKIDPETREKIKTSPKITEDSLEFLGGDGKLYTEFLTARSRYGILKTWIENTDENGNLHGNAITIGTPSMRSRHSIIVNVPSADSPWGKEMRSLFNTKPGWKLIGCDSSGNQARGLAHYLGDEKFIDTLLNGDIHQFNADIATEIIRKILAKEKETFGHLAGYEPFAPDDFVVKRSQAKRILYAFLFGASGGKLWSYIFGTLDEERGKLFKNEFIKAVPGFKSLLDKLKRYFSATSKSGDGWIPSIAGNRVYVDSFHKLLVYLLQSAEKITCATALMLTVQGLEAEGIPYIPCIFYHDEIDFMVPEEYAERAAEIGKASFKEGPKLYGIEIMDGEAKIGNNWYEVH